MAKFGNRESENVQTLTDDAYLDDIMRFMQSVYGKSANSLGLNEYPNKSGMKIDPDILESKYQDDWMTRVGGVDMVNTARIKDLAATISGAGVVSSMGQDRTRPWSDSTRNTLNTQQPARLPEGYTMSTGEDEDSVIESILKRLNIGK